MRQTMPLEISIEHNQPVSMAVLIETIALIAEGATRAAHGMIHDLGEKRRLSADVLTLIYAKIEQLRPDLLWLEAVAPGSSKLKGKIILATLAAITAVAKLMTAYAPHQAEDMTNMTEAQELGEGYFIAGLLEHFQAIQGGKREQDRSDVEIVLDGDRLVIVVRPAKRMMEIDSVLATPEKVAQETI